MSYYRLWSDKIKQRREEMSRTMEMIHEGIDGVLDEVRFEHLVERINTKPVKEYHGTKVAAVDGGEGAKELAGSMIYLIRASGFCSEIGKEGSFMRDLDLGAVQNGRQATAKVQFMRMMLETRTARKAATEYKPEYLLIDGSLLVNVEIDPINTDEYKRYLNELRLMFAACEKNGVQLVGVSEDSSSRGLIGTFMEKEGLSGRSINVMKAINDTALMQFHVYKKLYDNKKLSICTKWFIPSSNRSREWIKEHTGIDYYFPTVYFMPTKFGRPMRVDFPVKDLKSGVSDKAKEITEFLSAISQNPAYDYPFPLYMAHQDAEMPAELTEKTSMLMEKNVFSGWLEEYMSMYGRKRRDSRPKGLG